MGGRHFGLRLTTVAYKMLRRSDQARIGVQLDEQETATWYANRRGRI